MRLIHSVVGQCDRFSDLVPEIFAFTNPFAQLVGPLVAEGQRRGELGPGDPAAVACAYWPT